MPALDELKQRIRAEASENPENFFAVSVLHEAGFERDTCTECGTVFWAKDPDRAVCGEPDCSGGYTFINDSPASETFDVVSAWEAWADFMEKRGYTPVERYPLAARWRDDTEVVRASIYDFQPYVVSGEVEPPANPLVIPQFCFRSNDIDNVGITGRHYTGFIMDGQCAFTAPDEFEQEKYFRDMLEWITDGMGIPAEEVIIHEDAWGGGGNLGASMEFFVRGLELFNQVYMTYEIDDDAEKGYTELDTKVLDMGMGHNRIVWMTHGSETSYEANMPQVVDKLYEATGVDPDRDIWAKFLPHAGHLNLDEVDDIDAAWNEVAEKVSVETPELKDEIMPAAALYAIADHTRCLLVALNDGLLPSNAGERHALRVMARRCFEFIERYDWDLDINTVLEWHAEEFGELYPDLQENLDGVKEIMDHERRQYDKMQAEAERLIERLDTVDADKMVELYDSHGITPDMLQRHGIDVEVPQDFYKQVAERHSDAVVDGEDDQDLIDLGDAEKTERLYFEDEYMQEFDAEVVAVRDGYVVLENTAFYPTSGGQEHDTGMLRWEDGRTEVTDVVVQDGVILHKVRGDLPEEGTVVNGTIDWDRRQTLRRHHTATHLINAAAKQVLGDHIWQAGSHKGMEKARLDVTHYELLDRETIQQIEAVANEMVDADLPVRKEFLSRSEAEDRYGFRIYQGGAVPGKTIRIVTIGDNETTAVGMRDVEACGGTHVEHTGEVGLIRVVNSRKIQDGTIRLEYVAGEVAEQHDAFREDVTEKLDDHIDTDGYALEDLAEIFSVEVEQLPRIVERFVEEWAERKDELDALLGQVPDERLEDANSDFSYGERPQDPEKLFAEWKQLEKDIEDLESMIADELIADIVESDKMLVRRELATDDVGMLIRIAKTATGQDAEKAVVIRGKNAVIGAAGADNETDMADELAELADVVQGDAAFAKGFKLKD